MMSSVAILFASCGGNAKSGEVGEVASATEGSATYTIDSTSTIGWEAGHVLGIGATHNGSIGLTEGSLNVEDGKLVAGNFTLDMNNITVTDLTPETGAGDFIGHITGAAFFNVKEYSTAKFELTGAEAKEDGENTHLINGNLTLKDNTRSVSFPATVRFEENSMSATGSVSINRLDWGLNYDNDKQDMTEDALSALKNGAVDKTIKININLKANK